MRNFSQLSLFQPESFPIYQLFDVKQTAKFVGGEENFVSDITKAIRNICDTPNKWGSVVSDQLKQTYPGNTGFFSVIKKVMHKVKGWFYLDAGCFSIAYVNESKKEHCDEFTDVLLFCSNLDLEKFALASFDSPYFPKIELIAKTDCFSVFLTKYSHRTKPANISRKSDSLQSILSLVNSINQRMEIQNFQDNKSLNAYLSNLASDFKQSFKLNPFFTTKHSEMRVTFAHFLRYVRHARKVYVNGNFPDLEVKIDLHGNNFYVENDYVVFADTLACFPD